MFENIANDRIRPLYSQIRNDKIMSKAFLAVLVLMFLNMYVCNFLGCIFCRKKGGNSETEALKKQISLLQEEFSRFGKEFVAIKGNFANIVEKLKEFNDKPMAKDAVQPKSEPVVDMKPIIDRAKEMENYLVQYREFNKDFQREISDSHREAWTEITAIKTSIQKLSTSRVSRGDRSRATSMPKNLSKRPEASEEFPQKPSQETPQKVAPPQQNFPNTNPSPNRVHPTKKNSEKDLRKVHNRPNPYSVSQEKIESQRISTVENSVGQPSTNDLVTDTTDQIMSHKGENLDEEKVSRKGSGYSSSARAIQEQNMGRITPVGSPNQAKPNAFAGLGQLDQNPPANDFGALDIHNGDVPVESEVGQNPAPSYTPPPTGFHRPGPGGQSRGGSRGGPVRGGGRPAPGPKLPVSDVHEEQEDVGGENGRDKELGENGIDGEGRKDAGEGKVDEDVGETKKSLRPPGKFAPPSMRGRVPTRGRGMPGPRHVPPRVMKKPGAE